MDRSIAHSWGWNAVHCGAIQMIDFRMKANWLGFDQVGNSASRIREIIEMFNVREYKP